MTHIVVSQTLTMSLGRSRARLSLSGGFVQGYEVRPQEGQAQGPKPLDVLFEGFG